MGDEVPLTCDRLPSYFSRLGPFSVFGFRPFLDVPWPLLAGRANRALVVVLLEQGQTSQTTLLPR